jgi:hypothetical protein
MAIAVVVVAELTFSVVTMANANIGHGLMALFSVVERTMVVVGMKLMFDVVDTVVVGTLD